MPRAKFTGEDYTQPSNRRGGGQVRAGGLPFSHEDLGLLGRLYRHDEAITRSRLVAGNSKSVTLTKACESGKHSKCFSKTCLCTCGHGVSL